jgi:tetratricopeptide (TPR) repeat protein
MNHSTGLLWERKRLAVAALLLVVIGCAVFMIVRAYSNHPNLRLAQKALEQRDFKAASWHLGQYLEAHPGDSAARLLAAQTARRNGDFAQAVEHLEIYQRRGGRSSDADLEQRLTRLQAGDLEEADLLFDRCSLGPKAADTPLVLEALIEGCLRRAAESIRDELTHDGKQGEISIAAFDRGQRATELWLAQRPATVDQVQGFVWRGKLAGVARDFPKAQAAFRLALDLDPEQATAREYLGLSLVQEAPREAATHLQRVYDRALGELDQAAKILDGLLALRPDDVSFLVEYARVALDERRPEEAERWLKRALALAPDDAQAHLVYRDCLTQSNRPAEAAKYQDKYLQIDRELRAKPRR